MSSFRLVSTSAATTYRRISIAGVDILYREAGVGSASTIVLLHRFPSSSREFDPLIPLLATRHHVVAPDFPGFGQSEAPAAAYPAWQRWLRAHQPPTLVLWGRNGPSFIAAGPERFKQDLPGAEVHLLDAGHFALDESTDEIARLILQFMDRQRCQASPGRPF